MKKRQPLPTSAGQPPSILCASSSPLFSLGWYRLCVCRQQPTSKGYSSPSHSHHFHLSSVSIPASCIPSACMGGHTKSVRLGSEHVPTRLLQFARRPPCISGMLLSTVQDTKKHVQVEVVPAVHSESIYSQYFLFPKKDGGLWAILDLRLLNYALIKWPFRILTSFFCTTIHD